jgi:hypothetical protein
MPNKTFLSPLRAILLLFVVLMFALLAAPSPVSLAACACCAEPGEWYQRMDRIDEEALGQLKRLRFGPTAKIFLTAAGHEDIKGLPGQYESFNLTKSSFGSNRSIVLNLKGERGETGTLTLLLPKTVTAYGADLHDGEGAETVLYKEWRLEGTARGSGAFNKGITRGTKFQLILQGSGNMCTSAEQFKNWRLQITGPRASYAFYGPLRDPAE